MRRRDLRALVFFVAGCAIVWPASARSQALDDDPSPGLSALERLAGSYRYRGTPAEDHERIDRSIEKAIADLGWLGRRIAAKRLANHKELPKRIVIDQRADDVSITMGEYHAVAPIDGTPKALVAPNGRDARLSYRVLPNEILQFFVFEHAKRKSTYRLDDRGRLVMSVYMTSEKLASPIAYDLVYERVNRR